MYDIDIGTTQHFRQAHSLEERCRRVKIANWYVRQRYAKLLVTRAQRSVRLQVKDGQFNSIGVERFRSANGVELRSANGEGIQAKSHPDWTLRRQDVQK